MSKQKKSIETPKTETRTMTMPGAISALVVLVIFIVLGIMLSNRSAGRAASQQSPQETTAAFSASPFAPSETETLPETVVNQQETPHQTATIPQQQPTAAEGTRKTYTSRPPMTIDVKKTYIATITTPRGNIAIKLRPDIAPESVNSFVFLAREKYYDGLTWHRVLSNFMAQGGDPTGTGMGGPGYTVPAEFTDKILFDRPGILAMARSADPDSAGSQFFITTAPAPWLNNQYTPFGEVIQGQDIVNDIPLRDPETATTPGETLLKVTITEEG